MNPEPLVDPSRSVIELYHRAEVLNDELGRIERAGGAVVRVDAGRWESSTYLKAIGEALGFPDHYGANLDALADCLGDVAAGFHGFPAGAGVRVLAIYQFDAFRRAAPAEALAFVEALAGAAGTALKYGRPLLVMLQSDDPDLSLPPVAPVVVTWNRAEHLRANRHTT